MPRLHVCPVTAGTFAPNFTIGPPVVAALRKRSSMFLDCHLAVNVSVCFSAVQASHAPCVWLLLVNSAEPA
jgi:pentose-5-phosphate-3-epimerase